VPDLPQSYTRDSRDSDRMRSASIAETARHVNLLKRVLALDRRLGPLRPGAQIPKAII
jgi:hypothetical protein